MLTELCLYLKNWFDRNQPKYYGLFEIRDGVISIINGDIIIKMNQYYRIVGSVFNDGVYKHGSEHLIDETFEGAVWLMAVPADVITLSTEIAAWQAKYGTVDSTNMSPFNSESFAGYSYSKSGGSSSVPTWQSVYADRLRRYRKI